MTAIKKTAPFFINAFKACCLIAATMFIMSFTVDALAGEGESLGSVAKRLTKTFADVAALIGGISYIAGIGFAIGAILKFKQHKDNPTQIPVGTPIALLFVAASLLFLPSILKVAGGSLFEGGGTIAGPEGKRIPGLEGAGQ